MLLNLMLFKKAFPACLEVTAFTFINDTLMLCIGMYENLSPLFGCEGTFITFEPDAEVLGLLVSPHIGDIF